MQNKLQELTDKLYNEGLSKGKQEGEAVLANARVQAAEIVENAKKEAAGIVAAARKEAEGLQQARASRPQGRQLKISSYAILLRRKFLPLSLLPLSSRNC